MDSRYCTELARLTMELEGLLERGRTTNLIALHRFEEAMRPRARRCRVARDEWGSGANSRKNLANVPVDRVKIDGGFVADSLTHPQSAAIVRARVALARDLGINTVAEYAETEQIVVRVTDLGVESALGCAIGKPRRGARSWASYAVGAPGRRRPARRPELSMRRVAER